MVNSYKLGQPIVRNVKFTSEDLIEVINGKIYVEPLLFLSQQQNPFKLKERKLANRIAIQREWKTLKAKKNRVSNDQYLKELIALRNKISSEF